MPNIYEITSGKVLDSHVYTSVIIIFETLTNYYSIKVVGIIESYAVFIKLLILLIFVIVGVY